MLSSSWVTLTSSGRPRPPGCGNGAQTAGPGRQPKAHLKGGESILGSLKSQWVCFGLFETCWKEKLKSRLVQLASWFLLVSLHHVTSNFVVSQHVGQSTKRCNKYGKNTMRLVLLQSCTGRVQLRVPIFMNPFGHLEWRRHGQARSHTRSRVRWSLRRKMSASWGLLVQQGLLPSRTL